MNARRNVAAASLAGYVGSMLAHNRLPEYSREALTRYVSDVLSQDNISESDFDKLNGVSEAAMNGDAR